MKVLVIFLVLIGFTDSSFALYDGTENPDPHEPKNELEQKLVQQGFIKQEYPLMPYGFNHYFTKTEPQTAIGGEDFNKCSYSAVFPLHLDEKAHVIMKFPTDFDWPGAYNHSTFFVINGGSYSYTEFGETVTIDEPYVFNSIKPSMDSEYITIEFELDGGMNHLIINSTNVFESDNHTSIPCKPTFEKPNEYSYYDRILPITQQIEHLKLGGFPSDSFVCKSGLVGVLKYNDSPACVKPETKEKLMDRNWTDRPPCNGCGGIIQFDTESYKKPDEVDVFPEPEPMSESELLLHSARKSLKEAYQNHVNLGPYHIQDVIVGFGIEQKDLIIVIDSEYADSKPINTIREEIQRIVGNDVKINYVMYDEPIERHIETVIPYMWNKILHQKKIAYEPKDQSYTNTDEGFFPEKENRVCSPLVAPNGTEFFISSTFELEPFEVTGTFIDKMRPDDCHKIWKTDVIMTEPDRVTALWLENQVIEDED